jgi:mannose-1-phosphate guanylyltransferase/mannose-6-phosphate isomerase
VSARAILPVIMCGGAGVRLWPLSSEARPKPFHSFFGGPTLFQATAQRLSGPGFLEPVVICGATHEGLAREQLAEIGIEPATIVLEPCPRGTAGVAAVAAAIAAEAAPGASVLLAPADHVIADEEGFRSVVRLSAPYTEDWIITFGVAPGRPETGYGYIAAGRAIGDAVRRIDRFVEKPEAVAARGLIADGGLWNAGIFAFSPAVMLAELARLTPDIKVAAESALGRAGREGRTIRLDVVAYAACPDAPIDRAVMEKTDRAAVALCDVGWTDIGAWSEVWRLADRDRDGLATHGPVQVVDSPGALVWSDGPTVAVAGAADLVIVAANGSVLVAPRERAQAIRALVEAVRATKAARG